MDVHIGEMTTSVRAVDDRTLLSPDVLEVVLREVLARLASRQAAEAARRDEATTWHSVRAPGAP